MFQNKFLFAIVTSLVLFIPACSLGAGTSPTVTPTAEIAPTKNEPTNQKANPKPTPSRKIQVNVGRATAIPTRKAIKRPTQGGAMPGDVPAKEYWMDDSTEKPGGNGGFAVGGDDFDENIFERPFDAKQAYRPDIDVLGGTIAQDDSWIYVTIQLAGQTTASGKMGADYGVELDTNKDGRGEFVIWTQPAYTTKWTQTNTTIYGSTTNKVGGPNPSLSDAPWDGKTYDKVLFDGSKNNTQDGAWARLSPILPNFIEIAFNPDLVGDPEQFLWGVWADDGIKDPAKFDYNDRYTKEDAGMPYQNDPLYPPKAIFAVDNTCRMWYGFDLTWEVPGACPPLAAPVVAPAAPAGGSSPTYCMEPDSTKC